MFWFDGLIGLLFARMIDRFTLLFHCSSVVCGGLPMSGRAKRWSLRSVLPMPV